nr:Maf family protein [Dethiosulfovibrio faecalis]
MASGSPRRRELLSMLGWPFIVEVPSVEEVSLQGEAPEDMVRRLALKKADAVACHNEGKLVLAADTVVVLDGRVMGKPESVSHGIEMVESLSGREHQVITGVALVSPVGRISRFERSYVLFRSLSRDEIEAYQATGEGADKAGAYAIQGVGALMVEGIRGDFFNVMGLPLYLVSKMLDDLGFPLVEQWKVM